MSGASPRCSCPPACRNGLLGVSGSPSLIPLSERRRGGPYGHNLGASDGHRHQDFEGGDGGRRASWSRDRAWQLGSSKAGRSTCLTIAGDISLCAGPGCPEGRATLVKRLGPTSCGHFSGFMRCCSLNRLGQSWVPLCPCCMEASASREFLRRTAGSPPTFLFSLLGLQVDHSPLFGR